MDDRRWDLSIDGQEEDETLPRIDNVDWGDISKGVKKHKLDVSLVGLATGTDHIDAKIALTRKLIKIHKIEKSPLHPASRGVGRTHGCFPM